MKRLAFSFLAMMLAGICLASDHPTGLVKPRDHAVKAAQQNRRASPIVQAIRAGAKTPTLGPLPTLPAWDWTPTAGTPVHNQASCGSCWAFGTCATYNESLAAQTGSRNGDASEQDVLNNSGAGSCGGGYWAFDMFVKTGVGTNSDLPYAGYDGSKKPAKRPYKALTWAYVESNGGTPTDAAMKQALCQWGPIGVCINADNALQNYSGGVWRSPGSSTNHIVTVVGWDDSKKAWRVKNSWGSDWGPDGGYFWTAYGSNIGDGAAYVVCKPNWVDEADVPGIIAMGADAGRTEILIDGPTQAGHGEMVMLEAPPIAGARYTWSHVPGKVADANAKLDTDRRIIYFATPCGEDATFEFALSVAMPDVDPVVIWHTLTVGVSPVPPGPGPDPGPGPGPLPVLDAFGTSVRDWATSLVTAEMRTASAQGISDNFAAVAADIDAGKITTLATAMAAVRAANSKDLNAAQRIAWAPFFDQITARWAQALDDGELSDAPSMSLAGRQAAAGLKAAMPPKLQIEPPLPPAGLPLPASPPVKPAAVAPPRAAGSASAPTGHWEVSGLFGRQRIWVSDAVAPAPNSPSQLLNQACPSGVCPALK